MNAVKWAEWHRLDMGGGGFHSQSSSAVESAASGGGELPVSGSLQAAAGHILNMDAVKSSLEEVEADYE